MVLVIHSLHRRLIQRLGRRIRFFRLHEVAGRSGCHSSRLVHIVRVDDQRWTSLLRLRSFRLQVLWLSFRLLAQWVIRWLLWLFVLQIVDRLEVRSMVVQLLQTVECAG